MWSSPPVVVMMAWLRWSLFASSAFPQAAEAEQRSLLRAGAKRSREATPFVTLPQSLLLQRSGADKQSDAQVLSDSEASKQIKAASMRGGYGNELWNAVQDRASDIVADAREAFFADSMKAAATTVAPVTTTVPITTVDPAILAQQLKITKDAATARNLLVSMISRAQVDLLNRLNDISLDLEATELRAKLDLKAVNHSFAEAKNMPIMSQNADVEVKKIDLGSAKLKVIVPAIESRAATQSKTISELLSTKQQLEKDLADSKKLPFAKRRVQNNMQTLGVVVPRLERLERRVTKLESRLYDGNLTMMVKDTSSKEVMNVMEDVSRGFGRFIANAK